jgi:hypothetical protein
LKGLLLFLCKWLGNQSGTPDAPYEVGAPVTFELQDDRIIGVLSLSHDLDLPVREVKGVIALFRLR